jgi:hypothetical protein
MRPGSVDAPILRFHRIVPGAISPMAADRTALGSIPAAAHQFCEALRAASSFGWYIFPPRDIRLRWDGAQVFHLTDGRWGVLSSVVDPDHERYWNAHCPDDMRGGVPPYLSALFVPGVVQVWSGLLVGTAPDWSVLVRSPANLAHPRSYACYEGIVEADWFSPIPLFINLRLTATEVDIELPQSRPLFQLQPLHRSCYTDALGASVEYRGLEARNEVEGIGMSEADWEGLRSTIRSVSAIRPADTGRYGVEVRRRRKRL